MKKSAERRTSVRGRLLAFLMLPVAGALGIASIGDLVFTEAPIREAYDQALSDAAIALALNVQVDDQGRIDSRTTPEALNLLRTDLNDEVFFRISVADVPLVAGDPDLPPVAAQAVNPAHATASFRGKAVRLATYRTRTRAGTVLVTVGETLNKRRQVRERLWSTALWSDLAVLVAVLGLVWIGVRLALRPLDKVDEQLARRSPRDLAPVGMAGLPIELDRVIGRLNALLKTITESSEAERQFLDSAAHQLRTPLAGLLAQLELLVAEEANEGRRQRLAMSLDSAQRLSRTTHQLLTLARSEHRSHSFAQRQSCDLAAIAVVRVTAQVSRASAAGIDLGAEPGAATVLGVPWLLSEALDNLVDNALSYTQAGGAVTVRTGISADGPFMEVVDSGIGIPEPERALVLSRFYRGEQSRETGSGLGLAIVADVAALHEARLSIADGPDGRGTCIRLQFPNC